MFVFKLPASYICFEPLQKNGLQMIVRAHECVMDGFERFAQGHLITLFSATNYCGTAGACWLRLHLFCPPRCVR